MYGELLAHRESSFHSLKIELVYKKNSATRQETSREIFEWVATWYNHERRPSALGYMAPESTKS